MVLAEDGVPMGCWWDGIPLLCLSPACVNASPSQLWLRKTRPPRRLCIKQV